MTTPDDAFTEWDETAEDRGVVQGWRERLEKLPHLYRYVSIRGERFAWFYDLALRSRLYFASFDDLNDPFDGKVRPTDVATVEEKRRFWERTQYLERGREVDAEEIDRALALSPDEARRRMLEAHDEEAAKLGVVCLSETPDDLPMWGYYADGHRGMCLRFRTEHLRNPELDGCFAPMPIGYEDAYPEINMYRTSRFRSGQAVMVLKARDWSHEKEWRIVRHLGGRGHLGFNPAALDGVIMGCGISAEDEMRVKDVLSRREPRLELFKARTADREFGLIIEPA